MSTPLVAVLDYGIGNLRSAQKALQKVGADARLTSDAALIRDAHAAVLPGVGNFGACMTAVRAAGFEDLIHERIASGSPFLGICVGMQMLYTESQESPGIVGLNVVPGEVRYLPDTVKRPLHSQTIGFGPWPTTVTPCGIVTLRKLNTPPATETASPFEGAICVNAVLSTTSVEVGAYSSVVDLPSNAKLALTKPGPTSACDSGNAADRSIWPKASKPSTIAFHCCA